MHAAEMIVGDARSRFGHQTHVTCSQGPRSVARAVRPRAYQGIAGEYCCAAKRHCEIETAQDAQSIMMMDGEQIHAKTLHEQAKDQEHACVLNHSEGFSVHLKHSQRRCLLTEKISMEQLRDPWVLFGPAAAATSIYHSTQRWRDRCSAVVSLAQPVHQDPASLLFGSLASSIQRSA